MNTLEQEILAIGKWNGREFTSEDLDAIVQAFADLKAIHKVPLKLGHEEEGMQIGDGYPALGWVGELKRVGDKLVATLTDLPDIVFSAMQKKMYRTVSAELLGNVKYKNSSYMWVLDGLALLGADIPAVNTLNDLAAYLSVRGAMQAEQRVAFSAIKGERQEKRQMPMTEEEKAEFEALKASVRKQAETNAALSAKNAELEAERGTRIKAEETAKFTAEKKTISDDLEKLVVDKKITPAQRDEALSVIKDGDATSLTLARATLSVLSKSPGISVKTEEKAKEKTTVDKEYEGMKPSQVLALKTQKLMASDGRLDFSAARARVIASEPELVKAYVFENDQSEKVA